VEPRKYSSGTKGRLKMHADQCRGAIHAHSPNFHLAVEFIESIDPEKEDQVWQRFEPPEQVLPLLQAWLAGEETPSKSESPLTRVLPASQMNTDPKTEAAVRKTRTWVQENSTRLGNMPALDAIEEVLGRFGRD
jgi:hypothetical protein